MQPIEAFVASIDSLGYLSLSVERAPYLSKWLHPGTMSSVSGAGGGVVPLVITVILQKPQALPQRPAAELPGLISPF
jgi:hypothetical protein